MGFPILFTDYPKHVFLILGNEFCERFSFYGMKAILVIFLTRALKYSENTSTSIYHGFNMACYFTPIFGAMLADGLLGKYKTILYISMIYVVGNTVMSLSAVPFSGKPHDYTDWLAFLGLALIATGTGGIKPCVNAFGADQFKEDQVAEKDSFFSMFYVSINMGSLLSMILTPLLRSNVHCFSDSCYALAFGVPAALMLMALIFFVIGTRFYSIVPPGNNIIGKMIGCVWTAIRERCRKGVIPQNHWLDYATVKYDETFVEDVKMAMRVMFMFLTFPIFWALYDQQGSRWILQAGQMDGKLGSVNIEPDLVPVINPVLVLILVPFSESILYPLMDKCNCLTTPLKKIGFGMFLCSMSFVITAVLQIGINNSQPASVASGLSRVQPINAAPCQLQLELLRNGKEMDPIVLDYGEETSFFDIPYGNETFTATYSNCSHNATFTETHNLTVELKDATTYPLVFAKQGDELIADAYVQTETKRTLGGQSTFMFINTLPYDVELKVDADLDKEEQEMSLASFGEAQYKPFTHGTFEVYLGIKDENGTEWSKEPIGQVVSTAGRVVAIALQEDLDGKEVLMDHELISANSIHILLQLPQYFVMTLSEVFFIITGMNFAYSQAPMTMKAVLQAALLLTSTFGNLIVVIIAGAEMPDRVAEFFLFAALMFVTTFIFAAMAHFYTYVEFVPEPEEMQNKEEPEKPPKSDAFPPKDAEKGASFKRQHSRQMSLRNRTRTNSSLYSYLGEGTKL